MKKICKCGCGRPVTFNIRKKEWNTFLKGHYHKSYQFDRSTFKTISTPEQAYWLGYFSADGYVRSRGYFGFHICMKDKTHLDLFLKFLKSNHVAKPYINNGYRVEIPDKDYCDNVLSKWGFVQGKSKTIDLPKLKESLYRHFIRGVFDGDGWVCGNGGADCNFGIIGNNILMEKVQNILVKNCNINKIPLHIDKRAKSKSIRSIYYSGKGNLKKIFKYLYNNCNKLYLKRKYDKWAHILTLQTKN